MRVHTLRARGLRNLAALELEAGPRFHVFSGDNGQGKTNLLEAIYVLATLRSFRTNRLGDLIVTGGSEARLSAQVTRKEITRDYALALTPQGRSVRIDGKAVRPISAYFGGFNVLLFAPEDLQIPRGAPAERRRFLDRSTFCRRSEHLAAMTDYEKVLKSRNSLLRRAAEGHGAPASGLLDVYDEQLAGLGAAVVWERRQLLDELAPGFGEAWRRIGQFDLDVSATYQAEWSRGGAGRDDLRAELFRGLSAARGADLARGATTIGPHRDDVLFRLGADPAAKVASQGQLRAMILAWKIAELALIERATGEPPILLLDDVSSELDATRNRQLFDHLRERTGQCFITTTDPRHVLLDADRIDFRVSAGVVSRV